jgi:TRAP-type C4-dicarboxylate transport system permease small subunit
MELLKKIQKGLDTVSTAIAGVLIAAMFLIVLYNVFARFLGGGITWYMESAQYLNVWAELIAGIGLCAAGTHLRINGLEQMLKGNGRRVVRILVDVSTIAFYLVLAYGYFLLASRSRQMISTMPALRMRHVYAPIPVFAILSALACVIHLVIDLFDKKAPVPDNVADADTDIIDELKEAGV